MIFTDFIEAYIRHHELLRHDGFYLVALSGGPDSVALLCALHQLGYSIEAVHCNFRLRGEESDRDERFCVELCQRMNIPLHRTHFDTETYALVHQVSIEMAARELRYRYFEQLRADLQADGICVAHHQDDQVETVLLHLVRGTGLKGLLGMKPKNGRILRPLLCVNRNQVDEYLSSIHQDYVVDHTNLEADMQRNKLRLEVIPLLKELNPAVGANILRMSDHLKELDALVDYSLKETMKSAEISNFLYDWEVLKASVAPISLLWALLSPYGFNRAQVDEMAHLAAQPAHWMSPTHVVLVDRDRLYLIGRACWDFEASVLHIPEAGTYIYKVASITELNEKKIRLLSMKVDASFAIDHCASVANLDASKLHFPLCLRPFRHGDRFVPFGMKGSKLVSDYLKDAKCSQFEKRQQLVLTDRGGQVIWLVGRRIDARFVITQATCDALRIEVV